ncbi:hypothetical protein E3E31_01940 [Thermococcus sp. M39]|uniref:hypothetical protein n=1 Tax=unclassified Thermococcus TaxID=2627626 RepID=UPI00143890FF|nr:MULTISPECIES: hypothetical protein [unclassified Thermococcus]NJE07316.1 hypothetical protein [Thermococcus sp. M39]NJE12552.1 hypothetical protein [Thermococcus sp. LS2]
MNVSQAGIYLMIDGVLPMIYAPWVDWSSDTIKKAEPLIYELEDAIERSFKIYSIDGSRISSLLNGSDNACSVDWIMFSGELLDWHYFGLGMDENNLS